MKGLWERTDLPTGSMGTLVRSIREKLFVLEDDVTCPSGTRGRYNHWLGEKV